MHDLLSAPDPVAETGTLEAHKVNLLEDWANYSRDDQRPPAGEWTTWLLLGGRGAGAGPVALVGETLADVRDVMVEGESGLLAIHPPTERPRWQASRRRLEWPNGVVALAFSSEDPDSLRGPQFATAWADELAKWRRAEATWDMLQFGLRLGPRPRQMVTTTPRPLPLLKTIMAAPETALTRAATRANENHLAPAFLEAVVARYRGTRLGRQELDAELIEDRPDALWSREMLERCRIADAPPQSRIVVAVDPPASSAAGASRCGIVAAGIAPGSTVVQGARPVGYVLADATVERASPAAWAARAVSLYHALDADRIVAEVNQGGDMVAAVIRQTDPAVPVTSVRASRGKWVRAEPVAALYEQGRVRHVGAFAALEDEMCDFGPGEGGYGLSSGASPDRLDALVWALTALMLGVGGEARVRGL